MCREICGVGARQAAETLAELRRALVGRMKRIIEGQIALNPVSCVCVNCVIRCEQIAAVCEVPQPPRCVVKQFALRLMHGHFHHGNR